MPYPNEHATKSAEKKKKSLYNFGIEAEDRFIKIDSEFRLNEDKNQITGYAAVFNSWSNNLGGFKEIIRQGAFKKSIKENDIRATYNHNYDNLLGRTNNGTLKLAEDSHGLEYQIDLPDTSYARDLKESIKRKDITGSSFQFRTIKDAWNDNYTKRELLLAEVLELGPVAMPAYDKTSAKVRSFMNKIGINFNSLCIVLNKSKRNIDLTEEDIQILNYVIGKLQRCIPGTEQDEIHSDEIQDDHSIFTRARNIEVMAKIKLLEVI